MPPPRARTVAVVGAGAAGLVAARELRREGHEVTVFEKSCRVGGTWAYDPRAESDPVGLDPAREVVHGSMYASLRTNLPRELMGFSGFGMANRAFAGDPRTFPGHQEVLAFLQTFAEEADVARLVRLRAEVVRVVPVGQGGAWRVTWRGETGDVEEEEVFDAVVVCNGHCTIPRVPKLQGIEKYPGKQMHSHNYRTPEPFQHQIVVIIGLGASGIDIAREISRVAKEVHIACRYAADRIGKLDIFQNVWMHAEVSCVQDDGMVCFTEDSSVAADAILYCTGYEYHFPFLDAAAVVAVDDNRVGPLYKHVFPPRYAPSLSFIGLQNKALTFLFYELQSKWVASVLSGKAALPSEEDMLAAVDEDYQRMEEKGKPKRHTHSLMSEWLEYMNWLAGEVGAPQLEEWMPATYEKVIRCIWTLNDGYRDSWGKETSGARPLL